MGTTSRSQLEERVRFALGNRDDVDEQLSTWVNDAHRELCSRSDIVHTGLVVRQVAVALGAGDVSVATDEINLVVAGVLNIAITAPAHNPRLSYITPSEWSGADHTVTGPPTAYTRFGGFLRFFPVPLVDTTLEVLYYREPAALSAPTSAIAVSDLWSRPIVALAISFALDDMGEEERSVSFYRKYERLVANLLVSTRRDELNSTAGLVAVIGDI